MTKIKLTYCGMAGEGPTGLGLSGTCFHGPSTTIEDACVSVRMSLAQSSADITSDEIPAIIAKDQQAIRDFKSWLGFQRAYRHHRSAGHNDVASHQFACEHSAEFAPK